MPVPVPLFPLLVSSGGSARLAQGLADSHFVVARDPHVALSTQGARRVVVGCDEVESAAKTIQNLLPVCPHTRRRAATGACIVSCEKK